MISQYIKLRNFRNELLKRRTTKELLVAILLRKMNLFFIEEQIISPYIVDFYIPRLRLALEIDGSVHNKNIQKEKDYKKDDYLMSIGLMVQRFKNSDSNEYIIKRLLEYPKHPKCKNKIMNLIINELNFLFHSNKKISKFNDIKELLDSVPKHTISLRKRISKLLDINI